MIWELETLDFNIIEPQIQLWITYLDICEMGITIFLEKPNSYPNKYSSAQGYQQTYK